MVIAKRYLKKRESTSFKIDIIRHVSILKITILICDITYTSIIYISHFSEILGPSRFCPSLGFQI